MYYIMLNNLCTIIDKKMIGLYRDDGLTAISNANGPKLDSIRKKIVACFKEQGLSITIETNLTATEFLDVSFDLANGSYFPYRKPNDRPLYINVKSNHPPNIINDLPKMINNRLSDLSCNVHEFTKAKSIYETALKESGYETALSYKKNPPNQRNRNIRVLWFNPPYNKNLQTNIGKIFLNLVRKHFNRSHKYAKIFNQNTLKLSYSCTPNVATIIKQHNAFVLNGKNDAPRSCNCRVKDSCPLQGNCLAKSIVYRAELTTDSDNFIYYGLCEGEFKTRHNNHTKSFRHKNT